MQPVVSILVNPIYLCSLRFGLIRKPIIQAIPSSSSDLRSVSISSPTMDQQDMERRRQIALRALNERFKAVNTTDSNKSLPKSFPQTQSMSSKHHHGHQQHHSHGHSHNSGFQVIPKFDINEIMKPIPLPPPPSMLPSQTIPSPESKSSYSEKSSELLINLDDSNKPKKSND